MGSNKSFLSGDVEASELINEELSVSMSFYYAKVRDSDDLDWGRLLVSKRLLEESESQLCINRIFTTGLPREAVGRYYSRKPLKTI